MKNNTAIVKTTSNTSNNTVTLAQVQLKQVIEQLKDMSDSSLQICHNSYCIEIGYEDIVYDNDEHNVNEQFETPFDVLRNIQYYNLSDNYFYFHNGNLVSFNYLTGEDSPITFSELAQWVVDNDLYNEYDIDVTTLEDMLTSVEDNINDDENLLYRMCDCLDIEHDDSSDDKDLIKDCMVDVSSYDYKKLKGLMEYLGINYK